MKLKMTLAVAALLASGLFSAAAYADTVTFTLATPSATMFTGTSLAFNATVSAASGNSGSVFLNGDSFNVTAPVTLDDSDFFNNFPLSLAPGASYTGALFVLTAPLGMPVGTYLGTFTLLGGANGNANNTLGTVNFGVNVVTPEPSSIVLLLTGITGLVMAFLRAGFRGSLRSWIR